MSLETLSYTPPQTLDDEKNESTITINEEHFTIGDIVVLNGKEYAIRNISSSGRPGLVNPKDFDNPQSHPYYPKNEQLPNLYHKPKEIEEERRKDQAEAVKIRKNIELLNRDNRGRVRDLEGLHSPEKIEEEKRKEAERRKDQAEAVKIRKNIELLNRDNRGRVRDLEGLHSPEKIEEEKRKAQDLKNFPSQLETLQPITAEMILAELRLKYPQVKIQPDGTVKRFFNRRRAAKLEKNDPRFAQLTEKLASLLTGRELTDDDEKRIHKAGYDEASETGILPKSNTRRGVEKAGDMLNKTFDAAGDAIYKGRDVTQGRGPKWERENFKASISTDEQIREDNDMAQLREDARQDQAIQKAGYDTKRPQHGEFQKRGIFTKLGEGLNKIFTIFTPGKGKTPAIRERRLQGGTWAEKEKELAKMSPEELAQYDKDVHADEAMRNTTLEEKFAHKDLSHIPDETHLPENEKMSILDYMAQLKMYGVKAKPDGSIALLSGRKHKKLYKANKEYAELFDDFNKTVVNAYNGPRQFRK